jgi:hypothetical protein
MSSRLLSRSALLLVLAVVASGLLGARPVDPPAGPDAPTGWSGGEEGGPMIVARATDRMPAAVRPLALAAVAAAGAGLVAAGAAGRSAVPVSAAGARSEALRTVRRRGPPAGRAR